MEFPALKEAEGKLDERRAKLRDIFDEAGPELDMSKVKVIDGDATDKVDAIRALNDEVGDLAKKVDEYKAMQSAAEAAYKGDKDGKPDGTLETGDGRDPSNRDENKSLGELFIGSDAYKTHRPGGDSQSTHLDVEIKALFQTTDGWAPEVTRTGRFVDLATRPIQLLDLLPSNTTTQQAVVYMRETVFNNTAAEVLEGGTYPEAELQVEEASSPVRKIAVWLPVTDEQLEDEPQARGYINNRLPFMIRQRADRQVLVGDGIAPNLTGILNTTGIQTTAKAAEEGMPDALLRAMRLARVNARVSPSAVVMHPANWEQIRLIRTTDGQYIWGHPSQVGPDRVWGLLVVENDVITENTALVGDFTSGSVELTIRRGLDVQVSNSHSTFFVEGKQAIRADFRAALPVYRPAAFVTVTALDSAPL